MDFLWRLDTIFSVLLVQREHIYKQMSGVHLFIPICEHILVDFNTEK